MEYKEYFTTDKSTWPVGPWTSEPDKVQFTDKMTSFPCLIVRNGGGSLCGYVGVPLGHPLYGVDYNDLDMGVHGGLTFAGKCQEDQEDDGHGVCHKVDPDESDNVWWLGFDCAHYMDISPLMLRENLYSGEGSYKDIEYVKSQISGLAFQIAADIGEHKTLGEW